MQLEEYKKINFDTILQIKQYLKSYNLDFDFYYNIENHKKDKTIIVKVKDNLMIFSNPKECYEELKPIIQAMRNKEDEMIFRERVIRDCIIDAVNEVTYRFSKEVYTLSLADKVTTIDYYK